LSFQFFGDHDFLFFALSSPFISGGVDRVLQITIGLQAGFVFAILVIIEIGNFRLFKELVEDFVVINTRVTE